MFRYLLALSILLCVSKSTAMAADVCGNGVDDDGNSIADESCYPGLTNPLVDSPLSPRDTGFISPTTGSLYYALPPDLSSKVPYGPPLEFRRAYGSQSEPPTIGFSDWRRPLGKRWFHNYMGWIDEYGTAAVIRLPSGQDVVAVPAGGCKWETHAGQATKSLTHCSGSSEWTLTMLDGSKLYYATLGFFSSYPHLQKIITPNNQAITITYNFALQVSSVTDASGDRQLQFSYSGNRLSGVHLYVGGTLRRSVSFGFSSDNLTTVTIGGQLVHTNTYSGSDLTQIQDGGGQPIVKFAYDSAVAGRVVRVDTARGMVGLEFNSSRSNCSGKTVLYFNRGSTLTCSVDGDCGSGYLCGGKTGSGSTGQCFRAARCLTTDTSSSRHEDVVTTVTAIGPPGESCEGACLDVSEYFWSNGLHYVASLGVLDPSGNYSVRAVNSYGMPTHITYGDKDQEWGIPNAAREVYLRYTDTNFPGRVTEIRRPSKIAPSACAAYPGPPDGCHVTSITWNASIGKPWIVTEHYWTLDSNEDPDGQTSTITYTYDTKGRLLQIDGPLPTSDDLTVFEYWSDSDTDVLKRGFLHHFKRKKDATKYITTSSLAYDFWGNPTALQEADGTLTCLTFDAIRGYLAESREAMAGQTDCSTVNAADLTTSWTRDSALRLVQLKRPDDSCIIYEYGHAESGRPVHLLRTKRRDDCDAFSAGDRQEYVYDAEGLVTEIQTYDAAGVITEKQLFSHYDSRDLQRIINPVDTSKWTGLTYDARGLLMQIDAAGNLGKTVFHRDDLSMMTGNDGRITSIDRYKTPSAFDTWNLLYDFHGLQTQVKDNDNKTFDTVRDDRGRIVKVASPDMAYPTLFLYDTADRLVTQIDAAGGGSAQQTHTFTYDHLGRLLTADYAGMCVTGNQGIEIWRAYDELPIFEGAQITCPSGMTCSRLGGRLAWVNVILMCTPTLPDWELEQQTFYAYDDAGRKIREYIRDDVPAPNQRIADHQFEWTKGGQLSKTTLPSTAVIGATFGSAGNNSDSDRLTAIWRTNTSTPVADEIAWFPYGPLKQYNQQNNISNTPQRTRITRNLAYRITGMYMEPQTGGTANFSMLTSEDAKGRITKRDYSGAASGVQDSFFLYDDQDRVTCESATLVSSCPTSGTSLKNNHSVGFTNAGDWKKILRPIAGATNGLRFFYRDSRGCGEAGVPGHSTGTGRR